MDLLDAIKSRDISIVRSLLDQGFSPNGDPEEKHPLNLAIELNSIEIISLLIEYGVDLDLPINPLEKRIALHCAVMHCNKEIVMKILERTVNWQAVDIRGNTVLHLTLESKEDDKIEIMKIFLDLGMDVDVKNVIEETPLLIACKYRQWSVADFLIKQGANINSQDCNGDSIVHCLMMCEGKQMCLNEYAGRYVDSKAEFTKQLLCKGVVADSKNKAGQTPFELAIRNNQLSALLILLMYMKNLSFFISEENQNILHSILKIRTNAYYWNQSKQIEAVVKILLDRQVPVDVVDTSGNTLLHIAAKEKKFFVLPTLLEHFDNVNAYNNCGETALHVIVKVTNVCKKVLEDAVLVMLSKGASMSLVNNFGLSPVHLAAERKHLSILQIFKEQGADLKILTATGENLWHLFVGNCSDVNKNEDMINFLANEGLDINATTQAGSTPLHLALQLVKALIANGADVNLREESSRMMPIHIAGRNSDKSCRLYWQLLQAGADPNAKIMETSALHLAARCPKAHEIIQDLVRSGADLDAVDEYGRTPMRCVIENENLNALFYLLALGEEIADHCDANFDVLLEQVFKSHPYREYATRLQCLDMPIIDLSGAFEGKDDPESMEFSAVAEKQHLHMALSEVEKMKALQIGQDKSLYDFMRMSLRQRMIRAEQGELAEIVAMPDLEYRFFLYYDMILRKYNEALMRKLLLAPAKLALNRLVNVSLPDLCVDVIFGNLKNHSLRLLIRASDM